MHIFSPMVAQRIIFILGVTNAIMLLALFSSCRCVGASKVGALLMKRQWFKRYYKYHCYLWWILLVSVAIHMFFAINLLGFPF